MSSRGIRGSSSEWMFKFGFEIIYGFRPAVLELCPVLGVGDIGSPVR